MHYDPNQLVFKFHDIFQFRIWSPDVCVRILLIFHQKRKDIHDCHFYHNQIFAFQFYFKYIELSIISISCASLSKFYRSDFCQIIFEYCVFFFHLQTLITQNIHKQPLTSNLQNMLFSLYNKDLFAIYASYLLLFLNLKEYY